MRCSVVSFRRQLGASSIANCAYFWAAAKHSSGDRSLTKGGRALSAQKLRGGTCSCWNLTLLKVSLLNPVLTLAGCSFVVLKKTVPPILASGQHRNLPETGDIRKPGCIKGVKGCVCLMHRTRYISILCIVPEMCAIPAA